VAITFVLQQWVLVVPASFKLRKQSYSVKLLLLLYWHVHVKYRKFGMFYRVSHQSHHRKLLTIPNLLHAEPVNCPFHIQTCQHQKYYNVCTPALHQMLPEAAPTSTVSQFQGCVPRRYRDIGRLDVGLHSFAACTATAAFAVSTLLTPERAYRVPKRTADPGIRVSPG
jgi:hypothetical protein